MDFTHSRGAYNEARRCKPDSAQIRWLTDQCRRQAERLGRHGVANHSVPYDSVAWPELPAGIGDGERITRGHVFELANAGSFELFTASYTFGMGRIGYGRSRYDDIVRSTPPEALGEALDRVREIGRCQGRVLAYAQLYGGHDRRRARPGAAPWSRIHRFGPAFFTKFLYFAVPGALILDQRLARRVAALNGKEYGYLRNGRPVAWTPYRYAVYQHWMTETAAEVSKHTTPHVVTPELLELTLFETDLAAVPSPSRHDRPRPCEEVPPAVTLDDEGDFPDEDEEEPNDAD
jgi:hypothetical protein